MPLIQWIQQNLGSEVDALSAAVPIVLLPVRLETRFFGSPTPTELRIRVYPDGIFVNTHEEDLTSAEIEAGETFWTTVWADAEAELAAWTTLVAGRRSQRAAYIADQTQPSNYPPTGSPPPAPIFPTLSERETLWSRAPRTKLLPTRFVAIAYRGGTEIRRVHGAAIPDELILGPDPQATSFVDHDGMQLDAALDWAVDFDVAEANGMGLRLPLTAADAVGFDRLLVFGIKSGLTPSQAAARLEEALHAHHHTKGLALVPQGTPTNNTSDQPAGYPGPDDPIVTFAIERGDPLAAANTDGAELASALGVSTTVFDHIQGAGGREQVAAKAMNEALWPCTLGYFLEQLASPLYDAFEIQNIRTHFEDHVRGRGPLPAFRVGNVPYGILPVSSVKLWQDPSAAGIVDTKLPGLLRSWRTVFLSRSGQAPHVGRTPADPDADLLQILGLDASTREVRLRETLGPAYVRTVSKIRGNLLTNADTSRASMGASVFAQAGLGTLNPRLRQMTWEDVTLAFRRPFVADMVSETAGLPKVANRNYIEEIRASDIGDLKGSVLFLGPRRHHPLLYHLLRQSALIEYDRVALNVLEPTGNVLDIDRREVELRGIAAVPDGTGLITRPTLWDRFDTPHPATPSQTVEQFITFSGETTDDARAPVRKLRAALDVLAPLPTAELERLLTETLDTCSHRLDAWLTSLASKRLRGLRGTSATGAHLGAYAFVENLKPRVTGPAITPGGFIHAPSAAHAAAAAVLRSAHLTRPDAVRDKVTVDLSSERVRGAIALLDGVQQGQPLGAILGYRFERAMHDAALDMYIERFRRRYPLTADPGAPPAGTAEIVAARNVVNGLAVANADVTPAAYWTGFTPAITVTDDIIAIKAVHATLAADVDGLADLLLAESVFQAVRGNVDAASATLGTLGGAGTVAMPQIVEPPTAGINFTQRVAVVLGADVATPDWAAATPRANAEPRLNAWVAGLLGDPDRVVSRVRYPNAADPNVTDEVTVSLTDLGIHPLDVLAVARRSSPDGSGELAARIQWHMRSVRPRAIEIVHELPASPPANAMTLVEALEVARTIDEVVGAARPLRPVDLQEPHLPAPNVSIDAVDLTSRADAVASLLTTRHAALTSARDAVVGVSPPVLADLDTLRMELWAHVNFGLADAIPVDLHGSDAAIRDVLIEQADRTRAENQRRRDQAPSTLPGDERLQILLGQSFTVLPHFTPHTAGQLGPLAVPADEVVKWRHKLARVRPAMARLRMLDLVVTATNQAQVAFDVAQLPNGNPWLGASFDPESPPPAGGVALALQRALGAPAAPKWAGLLVDEWTERIPAASQLTSLAVHHDAPGAEAPQAILVAVPPIPATLWSTTTLIETLNETMDLAKIRSVDLDLLNAFYMLVPTIYCAGNIENETVANDLGTLRIEDFIAIDPEV